jgi:hypothetical protein
LPEELAACRDHLDMLGVLGLDVFSRNIYCLFRHVLVKFHWLG